MTLHQFNHFQMYKTIIIDDEPDSLSNLEFLIQKYCPALDIIARCNTPAEGFENIISLKPDLVFLDVEMPNMTGFELLEKVKAHPFTVIFTTAYHQYAIKAIRYSALDYLVKPIDPKELVPAVDRYLQIKNNPNGIHSNLDQFQFLLDRISQKESSLKKIAIPNMEGFKLIDIDDISYCEADDNYTHIHLKNKHKITASRTLKDIQNLLTDYTHFFRIHNSYLINLHEVNQYIKGEGGHVVMNDGAQLGVSRNKKEALMKYLVK